MDKIRRFLGLFAFLFVVIFGTNAFADDYVCADAMKYSSCNSGYYLSDCDTLYTGAEFASQSLSATDLTVGNSCKTCPTGRTCTGGLTCPSECGDEYEATGNLCIKAGPLDTPNPMCTQSTCPGDRCEYTNERCPSATPCDCAFTAYYTCDDTQTGCPDNATCTWDTEEEYETDGVACPVTLHICNAGYHDDGNGGCDPNTYTITYKNGGGVGDDITVEVGYMTTFTTKTANAFTNPGHVFAGWSAPFAKAGAEYQYNVQDNVTLTAQWTNCPDGHYCPGGTPQLCPEGYRDDTTVGKTNITQCQMKVTGGYYVAMANDTTPTICPAGQAKAEHYVNFGSYSYCDDCGGSSGATYADVAGLAACKPCPTSSAYASQVLSYSSTTARATSVTACKANMNTALRYGTANSVECTYTESDAEYTNCHAKITTCNAGYYNTKATSASTTVDIYTTEGYEYVVNNGCVAVGEDYYSGSYQLTRGACPNGGTTGTKTTAAAATECYLADQACSGENGTGTNTCHYNSSTSAYDNCDTCVVSSCPMGQQLVDGACVPCLAENYCPNGEPVQCPTGYRDNTTVGKTNITQCQMKVTGGYYVAMANDTTPTICPAGHAKAEHYVNFGSYSYCDDCGGSSGATYADVAGLAACKPCPTSSAYASQVLSYSSTTARATSVNSCSAYMNTALFHGSAINITCLYSNGEYNNCNATVNACNAGYYNASATASGTTAQTYGTYANVLQNGCVAVTDGYYSATNALTRNACANGGKTGKDNAGTATECYLTGQACSGENGTGTNTCHYNTTTAGYTDCDTCDLTSCDAGFYLDGGVCKANTNCTVNTALCTGDRCTYDGSIVCNGATCDCPILKAFYTCNDNHVGCPTNATCVWNTAAEYESDNYSCPIDKINCNSGFELSGDECVAIVCDAGHHLDTETNTCQPNEFTIVYNVGTTEHATVTGTIPSQTCTYGSTCLVSGGGDLLYARGYYFNSWNCSVNGTYCGSYSSGGTVSDLASKVFEHGATVTMTAAWGELRGLILYVLDGATVSRQQDYFPYSDEKFSAPTKAGHVFKGWCWLANGTSSTVNPDHTCDMPNVELSTADFNMLNPDMEPVNRDKGLNFIALYAQWAPNTWNIQYSGGANATGDAPAAPTSCAYDVTCTAPENTYTNAGSLFGGWQCTGGDTDCDGDIIAVGTDLSTLNVADAATITLTATWGQCTGATYCDQDGTHDCPDGYKDNLDAGKTSIEQCQMKVAGGHYVVVTGETVASGVCAKGYAMPEHFVNYGDTSECRMCGNLYDENGEITHTQQRFYQDEEGQASCKACPTSNAPVNSGLFKELGGYTWYNTDYGETANTHAGNCYVDLWTANGDRLAHGVLSRYTCSYAGGDYCVSGGDSWYSMKACDAGYYQGGGRKYAGNYQDVYDKGCEPVGRGYWSADGAVARTQCPIGVTVNGDVNGTTAEDVTMADTPTECYLENMACTTGDGATGVKTCHWVGNADTGSYSNCGECVITACPAGKYLINGACEACTPDHYCPADSNPIACPNNGTAPAGAKNVTECYRSDVQCTDDSGIGTGTQTCHWAGDAASGTYSDCTECVISACTSGYYLKNGVCTQCQSGNWCEAGKEPQSCSTMTGNEYPLSAAGSDSINDCYRDCKATDVPNATAVTGQIFYGNVGQCVVTTCAAGYYKDGNTCQLCEAGNWCEAGKAPQTCPATHPNSVAGAKIQSQCYKTCASYELDNGMATPASDKAFWDKECEFVCTPESGGAGVIVGGVCMEIGCASHQEMIAGICQSCNRDNALIYKPIGNCEVETCVTGYHPNGDKCDANVVECTAPNALVANRTWDAKRASYSICKIEECVDGYHVESNACESDVQQCSIVNGIGSREWNTITGTWGKCEAVKCDAGYTSDVSEMELGAGDVECGRCRNAFGIDGDIAVERYRQGCEIASCKYQGELYDLQNNECVPICEVNGYTDETGTRQWNPSTKKCEFTCADGYTRW